MTKIHDTLHRRPYHQVLVVKGKVLWRRVAVAPWAIAIKKKKPRSLTVGRPNLMGSLDGPESPMITLATETDEMKRRGSVILISRSGQPHQRLNTLAPCSGFSQRCPSGGVVLLLQQTGSGSKGHTITTYVRITRRKSSRYSESCRDNMLRSCWVIC